MNDHFKHFKDADEKTRLCAWRWMMARDMVCGAAPYWEKSVTRMCLIFFVALAAYGGWPTILWFVR